MRPSVAAAWPAVCQQYEGRVPFMYLDTRRLVTTGTGNLIDTGTGQPPEAALALPWRNAAGALVGRDAIAAEWRRIKSHVELAPRGGWAFKAVATLHLDGPTLDRLLAQVTERFWAQLAARWPQIEEWPADAQLAALDLAWQNGPAFTDAKTAAGAYVWPNMRAGLAAQDWTRAASAVPGTGPRADHRKRLFRNAAAVARLGLGGGHLWDGETPKEPEVIAFRNGRTCTCVATSLPVVEQYMLWKGLIRESIDVFQLGYNGGGVAASAGTHDAGGCVDVGQYSDAQIDVWRLFGWTMQHREGVGSGPHAHGWPYGCPHLAPGAAAQERDWDRHDAGLVGAGQVAGRYPVKDWKTALNERKKEMASFAEEVAELAARKVLALDVIPNEFTGNDKNPTVALQTALAVLGKRTAAAEERTKRLEAQVAKLLPATATTAAVKK